MVTVQTCSRGKCQNGVSWIDISNNKGLCETCAKYAPMVVKVNLRHIYYGEPYIQGQGGDPVEWGKGN